MARPANAMISTVAMPSVLVSQPFRCDPMILRSLQTSTIAAIRIGDVMPLMTAAKVMPRKSGRQPAPGR